MVMEIKKMFGLSKRDREADKKAAREAKIAEHKSWIGKTAVASQSLEVIMANGVGYLTPRVTKDKRISGRVTDAGENVVCIDGEWFELDQFETGGIRVIEVLQ